MEIHLRHAYSVLWEMGNCKASYMQFVVNGVKHVKLLACPLKQHEHTHRLKGLQLLVHAVRDKKHPQIQMWPSKHKHGRLCSYIAF